MKTSNTIIAVLSAALLLLLTLDATAQVGMGEIRGTVTDSLTGEPIADVIVTMQYKGYPKTTFTDAQGQYSFKPIEAGTYSVTFQLFGKAPYTQQGIEVSAAGIKFVDMQTANGIMITGTVLYSDKIDMRENEDFVSISSIDFKRSAGGRGVGDVITTMVPGVTAISQNNKQLSIRGGRGDATQYIIDGVKVIGEPYIPQIGIGDVTVITGGLPAQYGDTTSGVIIITTGSFK